MRFHPYSEIFPLIEGADFDALVADIKEHGLRERIWLHDGRVLDGRNRFLACQKARVKPQYRQFKGKDDAALAFVVSANVQRRHLTLQQRAFAAARIATMRQGERTDLASREARSNSEVASREATSQAEAADELDVSRSSVQRARQVIEKGSKALQEAAESGDIPLKKAAAVVNLPKSEQLAAAKAKPTKESQPDIERLEPEEDEDAKLAQAEKEYTNSIDKVMAADDKLAAAHKEIKRQAAEIASLKLSRDGYQNRCTEVIERLKAAQRTIEKLERKVAA